jgi:hypothetical protein
MTLDQLKEEVLIALLPGPCQLKGISTRVGWAPKGYGQIGPAMQKLKREGLVAYTAGFPGTWGLTPDGARVAFTAMRRRQTP